MRLEVCVATSNVKLLHFAGEFVYSDSTYLSNIYSMALSEYTSGIYMLKVTNDKGLNSKVKLMIVH